MRILIAEDEEYIAKALKVILEKNKFSVDTVNNGIDAFDYINDTQYDAVVLDIMMPGMDGIEVLNNIRGANNSVPVMFLTAKSEIEDRIAGLNAGADDYLPKPFDSGEFLARVKALVRRSDSFVMNQITIGNTTLDCNSYELSVNNNSVRLNNKEFQILELFMRYPTQVFSTERLMDRIWGMDTESDIDVIWTYIGFVRKKLKDLNSDISIKTLRGAGYVLENNHV